MAIIMTEYIGKTLGEAFEELHDNIKLGTVDGGAFIYCGPADRMRIRLKEFDAAGKIEADKRIDSADAALDKAFAEFPSAGEYSRKMYKKTKGKSAGDIMGYLNFIDLEFHKLQNRIENLDALKKEKYVPFKDRVIKDARLSVDEPDTTIIVIEGREVGHYWTINEYANRTPERNE